MVISFEIYLKNKRVNKVTLDKELAIGLKKDSEERFNDSLKMKPKYKLENSYESIRGLIEALMALDGYKTYSHEAAISYLQEFKDFSDYDIKQLDIARQKRNGSKYYGENIEKEYADRTVEILKPIFMKLTKLLSSKLKSEP